MILPASIFAGIILFTHAMDAVRSFMHTDGAALLPELELLLFAFGILAMDAWIRQKEKYWSPTLALAGLVFSGMTLGMLRARIAAVAEFTSIHDTLIVDTYFLFFSALLLAATTLVVLLSVNQGAISVRHKARFYALLLFGCAGMMLVVSAIDLLVMFVALELAAVSCYFLAALPATFKKPTASSVKFLLSGVFGSAILAYAFSLLYGLSASTNIGKIASALARRHNISKVIALSHESGSHGAQMYQLLQSRLPEALHWHPFVLETLPIVAFVLVFFGLLVKLKAAAIHHPAGDSNASAPITPVLFCSGALVITVFAALLRSTLTIFADAHDIWWPVVAAVSVVMIAAGVVGSLRQDSIAGVLAYGSLAQIGYVLLGLVSGDEVALTAIAFYLFTYVFIVTGALAVTSIIGNNCQVGCALSNLRGLRYRSPLAAVLLLIFMIALAGFPPGAGFFARYSLFQSLLHSGHRYLAWIAAFSALPLGWSYLRVVIESWRGHPTPELDVPPVSFGAPEAIVLGVCAFVSLAAGLYSEPFMRMARYAFGQ